MTAPSQQLIPLGDSKLSLSRATLLAITEAHVKNFETMLEDAGNGARGIRIGECEDYLAIWNAGLVALKMLVPVLSEAHVSELLDALACGDYDTYLTEDETAAVLAWMGEEQA